jgi:Trans-aconitate methyltransferase
MSGLTDLETIIYNHGERLIPNVTHARDELVRHKSSYLFFYRIIEQDLKQNNAPHRTVKIVDLGCGVGHGCKMLSRLPRTEIVGVDISPHSLEYAAMNYSGSNIQYLQADLHDYTFTMPDFDYVVSRGSFEHIADGLNLVLSSKWTSRLLFDVPYNEPRGRNPHHLVTCITETAFSDFPNPEIFYQDLAGIIYDSDSKPILPNMIICACQRPDLACISDSELKFPLPVWAEEIESGWG